MERVKKSDNSEENVRLAFILLAILVYSGLTYNYAQTNPNNFPDLETRFRIDRNTDPDGIYRLSVYRKDGGSVAWWENDVVALERKILRECGQLSKFQGEPDSEGLVPVRFRVYQSDPPQPTCGYLTTNS